MNTTVYSKTQRLKHALVSTLVLIAIAVIIYAAVSGLQRNAQKYPPRTTADVLLGR